MGFVKVDVAKQIRKELSNKKVGPKSFDEVLKSIAETTILAIDGKKKKGGKIEDLERKKNILFWHEGQKVWLLMVSYGNELAYAFDFKFDKDKEEAVKKQAKDYLTNLGQGKIESNEKAEIIRVLTKAQERGKKLAAKNKSASVKK